MAAIGELDKRVELHPATRTSNGRGGWTTAFAEKTKVWAKIRQPSAKEAIKYKADEIEIDTIIEIRYRADVKKGSRVFLKEYGTTRRFDIDKALDETQQRRFLVCTAREVF